MDKYDWEWIKDVFPPPKRIGRPQSSRRKAISGILWVLKSGEPWRAMPAKFGKWQTVYALCFKWFSDGTLRRIVKRLGNEYLLDQLELEKNMNEYSRTRKKGRFLRRRLRRAASFVEIKVQDSTSDSWFGGDTAYAEDEKLRGFWNNSSQDQFSSIDDDDSDLLEIDNDDW